jgi:hypothetical protein
MATTELLVCLSKFNIRFNKVSGPGPECLPEYPTIKENIRQLRKIYGVGDAEMQTHG